MRVINVDDLIERIIDRMRGGVGEVFTMDGREENGHSFRFRSKRESFQYAVCDFVIVLYIDCHRVESTIN